MRQELSQLWIIVRGDSGFCRDELTGWYEGHAVKLVLEVARSALPERVLRGNLWAAHSMPKFNASQTEGVFQDFR